MNRVYKESEVFEKVNFTDNFLIKGEYDCCKFINCDFSNGDLSNINFLDSEFINCNLSLVNINQTAFRAVKFKDCKLLGLQFHNCNKFVFSVNFESCILTLTSFYKLNLKRTLFKSCTLGEVDFTEADLTNSVFDNCDLLRAIFKDTNLEKADFRTSYNYSIDPELNKLKKAKFSLSGVVGLLDKYDVEIS